MADIFRVREIIKNPVEVHSICMSNGTVIVKLRDYSEQTIQKLKTLLASQNIHDVAFARVPYPAPAVISHQPKQVLLPVRNNLPFLELDTVSLDEMVKNFGEQVPE